MNARWDYYSATVDARVADIADAVMTLPGAHDFHRRDYGMSNYSNKVTFATEGRDIMATLLHGGANGAPHVFASGDDAEPLAALLRREFPVHRVARCDTAQDIVADFDVVWPVLARIAENHGVKHRRWVPGDPEDGATHYIGSEKSPNRHRCYEKSKELIAKLGPAADVLPGVLRCELQIRPAKPAAKLAMSLVSPDDAWGVTAFSRSIASQFLENNPASVSLRPRVPTSRERTRRALLLNYGPYLRAERVALGSWPAVWDQLQLDLDDEL